MFQPAAADGVQSDQSRLRPLNQAYYRSTAGGFSTIVVAGSAGSKLSFVGTKHTNNPADPFFDRLRTEFNQFASHDSTGSKVVVLEGWSGQIPAETDSDEDVIRAGGETGLASRLAAQAGIEIRNYDPEPQVEFEALCRKFQPEEVFYWLVARQAVQWVRQDQVPRRLPWNKQKLRSRQARLTTEQLENYLGRLDADLGRSSVFMGLVRSYEALQATHRRLFGEGLDWNDAKRLNRRVNPVEFHGVINDISRASNMVRDLYLFSRLESDFHRGLDIFVLYGDGHAYALQDMLRSLG